MTLSAAIRVALFALPMLVGCGILGKNEEGKTTVNLIRLADEVALVREDIMDFAPMASPVTQAKLTELSTLIVKVEAALRNAGSGGPIDDAITAAQAALSLADAIATELPSDSDVRFYIAVAQVTLRHIAAARFEDA